jgi:hypothetical protein
LQLDRPEHRELIARLVTAEMSGRMTDSDRYLATSMIQYLFDVGGLQPTKNTCILAGVSPLRNMNPVGSA